MFLTGLLVSYLVSAGPPLAPPLGTLLIGDSLMKVGVAPVLKKELEAKAPGAVENKAKSATGLARPDYFDWPTVARDLLKTGQFGTVVMFIGANDCQGIMGDDGVARRFDSPEWRAVYGARVRAMAALLCEDGRKAFWIGLPPMEKASFDKRIRRLDDFLGETLTASGTCVKYVPTLEALGTKGKFAAKRTVDRKRVRIREEDGVHITQHGGALVADLLLKAMDGP